MTDKSCGRQCGGALFKKDLSDRALVRESGTSITDSVLLSQQSLKDIVNEQIAKEAPAINLKALELKVVQLDAKLLELADAYFYGSKREEGFVEETPWLQLKLQDLNERITGLQLQRKGHQAQHEGAIADLDKRVRLCEQFISQYVSHELNTPFNPDSQNTSLPEIENCLAKLDAHLCSFEQFVSQYACDQLKVNLRLNACEKNMSAAAARLPETQVQNFEDVELEFIEPTRKMDPGLEDAMRQKVEELGKRLQVVEEMFEEKKNSSPEHTGVAEGDSSSTEPVLERRDGKKAKFLMAPSTSGLDDQKTEANQMRLLFTDRGVSNDHVEANTVLNHRLQYVFQKSTWDTMVFYNLSFMNFGDTILNAISVAGTFITQLVFILVVARSMTDNPLAEGAIGELEQWRLFTGHRIDYYDAVTDSSLVARVCAGSMSLYLSGKQGDLYESLDDFMGKQTDGSWIWEMGFFDFLGGKVLSALCFFLWTMVCLLELKLIVSYALVLSLRVGTSSILMENDMELVLAQISTRRFAFVLIFNSGLRLIMLVALYVWGSLFLLYTISLENLLLNALALTFIMEIDDQIFVVFATASAKVIQQRVRSIHFRKITRDGCFHRYFDGNSLLTMLAVLAVFLFVWANTLEGLASSMDQAHEILCGGNINFVSVQNPGTHVLYYYDTQGYRVDSGWKNKLTGTTLYEFEALSRLVDYKKTGINIEKNDYAQKMLDYRTLKDLRRLSSREARDMMQCADVLDGLSYTNQIAWGTSLKYEIGLSATYTKCQHLQNLCLLYTSVRAMCAQTCGCDNVTSGIYDLTGCSSQCANERKNKISAVAVRVIGASGQWSSNCPDANATYNESFRIFFMGYAAYLNTTDSLNDALTSLGMRVNETLADKAWTEGCTLVASMRAHAVVPSPCDQLMYYGSIAAYCPDSCSITCPPLETRTLQPLIPLPASSN